MPKKQNVIKAIELRNETNKLVIQREYMERLSREEQKRRHSSPNFQKVIVSLTTLIDYFDDIIEQNRKEIAHLLEDDDS